MLTCGTGATPIHHGPAMSTCPSSRLILAGLSAIPPATGINYSSWYFVGFIFQYLIMKKDFAWWSKFNYVLSLSLECGTVVPIVVIFFTFQVGIRFFRFCFGWILNDCFFYSS